MIHHPRSHLLLSVCLFVLPFSPYFLFLLACKTRVRSGPPCIPKDAKYRSCSGRSAPAPAPHANAGNQLISVLSIFCTTSLVQPSIRRLVFISRHHKITGQPRRRTYVLARPKCMSAEGSPGSRQGTAERLSNHMCCKTSTFTQRRLDTEQSLPYLYHLLQRVGSIPSVGVSESAGQIALRRWS